MPFDGETYCKTEDRRRLKSQLNRVREIMMAGKWWRLADLATELGYPEASISARIRDLRKPGFGEYLIERRRVPDGNGLHEYRLVQPPGQMSLI
jgi:hypothetical protein